jgi:polyphosphate kinase 2 (PPK2 family)
MASDEKESKRLKRKKYEKELTRLQGKLCMLQEWVKEKGLRAIIVFEGRDAAGKGGTIKAITARTSPRVFRVVALPAPSDREKSQMYLQRYMPHFPAAGEIVIFDRSWYNRAGVERVMGFCTDDQYERFLKVTPSFEQQLTRQRRSSDQLWSRSVTRSRSAASWQRMDDPLRQWKLSNMDLPCSAREMVGSSTRWRATRCSKPTDTRHAPVVTGPGRRQAPARGLNDEIRTFWTRSRTRRTSEIRKSSSRNGSRIARVTTIR